jgi:hypothetical protein
MAIAWRLELVAGDDAKARALWLLPDWTMLRAGTGLRTRFGMTTALLKSIVARSPAPTVPCPAAYVVARIGAGEAPSFESLLQWEELLGCDTQLLHDAEALQDPQFFRGAQHPTLYILTGPLPAQGVLDRLFDLCFYEFPYPEPTFMDGSKINMGATSVEDFLIGSLILSMDGTLRAASRAPARLVLVLGAGAGEALQTRLQEAADLRCVAHAVAAGAAALPQMPTTTWLDAVLDAAGAGALWDAVDEHPQRHHTYLFLGEFAFEDDAARAAWRARLCGECVYDTAAWRSLHGDATAPPKGRVAVDAAAMLSYYLTWYENEV